MLPHVGMIEVSGGHVASSDADRRFLDLARVCQHTFGGFSVATINADGEGKYATEAGEAIANLFKSKKTS